jgi:hypothetical protein
MIRTFIALSLLAAPTMALAQSQPDADANVRTMAEAEAAAGQSADAAPLAASNTPPQKVRSVTVVGDKPCPKATGNEIVVCSHLNDGEQYRIPTDLRKLPDPAANNSWVNRAQVVDDVSRRAAGLPNTCSVIGDGGQTGCSMQALQQYQAEKRQQQREQDSIP